MNRKETWALCYEKHGNGRWSNTKVFVKSWIEEGLPQMKGQNSEYEVFSPWADADTAPLMGISPRITDLHGKSIGLICNPKVSAPAILTAVEERLKERSPTIKTSRYNLRPNADWLGFLGQDKEQQEDPELIKWARGVDAVIAGVGD